MDELRRRLTKIGNDPVLRAAARWTAGMAAAFFLVCCGREMSQEPRWNLVLRV